jgi:NAD(P)-dependent dehydrogenase (short-subunit alcohol dehydrogenase family)
VQQLQGKTAVFSGGAEGIRLNLAKTLGAQGMDIVLADIEAPQRVVAEKALQSGEYSPFGSGAGVGKIAYSPVLSKPAAAQASGARIIFKTE